MRQVKVRRAHAGKRFEHPEGFILLTHALSPFAVGLLVSPVGRPRKELPDDSGTKREMQASELFAEFFL